MKSFSSNQSICTAQYEASGAGCQASWYNSYEYGSANNVSSDHIQPTRSEIIVCH
jgi:hypothetical protein